MSEETAQALLEDARTTIESIFYERRDDLLAAYHGGALSHEGYQRGMDEANRQHARLSDDAWDTYCNRIGI